MAANADAQLEALSGREALLPGRDRARLREIRREARDRFARLGFPTTRDEDWKYTNVAAIARTAFRPAPVVSVEESAVPSLGLDDALRLVFVNGRLAPDLSSRDGLPGGVLVTSLRRAIEERPAGVEDLLGTIVTDEENAFAALNTACFEDGALVRIPDGADLARPIHLQFLTVAGGEPVVAQPRSLLVVGRGARATVIESYGGTASGPTFTNAVTEIVVEENGRLEHVRLEDERSVSSHVASQVVRIGRSASASTRHVSFGGGLARTDVHAVLAGEGADCRMEGLYLGDGERHVDYHTTIDHAKPHGTSRELFKGVLDGRSSGAFHGRIIVRPDAQKTDAKQTNRNLLLSDGARISTRPQLEIYADDVKCTHGATSGRLDADALFYLRSRGIGEDAARGLLTVAFATEILEAIPVEGLRSHLLRRLAARLPGGGGMVDRP